MFNQSSLYLGRVPENKACMTHRRPSHGASLRPSRARVLGLIR
jgi:hypothetical protein